MVRNLKVVRIIIFMILSIMSSPSLFAATIIEERPYEPVVIEGVDLDYFLKNDIDINTIEISSIKVYSYNASTDTWQSIPFQVDEIVRTQYPSDTNPYNLYFEEDTIPTFDGDKQAFDEIVFMVRDVGDEAPLNSWPEDAEARSNPRIMIRLTDPLNLDLKGYAYIYQSNTLPKIESSPYSFAYNSENDEIDSDNYSVKLNHNHGLIEDVKIKSPFGNNLDIVDTQKFRFEGSFNFGLPISYTPGYNNIDTANEEATLHLNQPEDGEYYYLKTSPDPVVRLIRQAKASVMIYGLKLLAFSSYFKSKYYPFCGEASINLYLNPDSLAKEYPQTFSFEMDMARISLDLNSNAVGMSFFNNHNEDILVDGQMDNIDTTIDPDSIITTWSLLTGPQGSLLTYFSIADTNWKDISLYYYDNLNGGNADSSRIQEGSGNNDTGDSVSYADNGLLVRNFGQNYLDLNMKLIMYFLPHNFSYEAAKNLANQIKNPVKMHPFYETLPTSVDEAVSNLPDQFHLYPNYPNPFNSRTIFSFQNDKARTVQLDIYDSQGKQMIRLANGIFHAGYQTIPWEGVDSEGKTVPTGIYIYRLSVGDRRYNGKLMYMK